MAKLASHRPPGQAGAGEAYLSKLTQDLARLLRKTQKDLAYDTLRLPPKELRELAAVLAEFAEDIHYEIGIWQGMEDNNKAFFGTPLPLVLPPGEAIDPAQLNAKRLRYLLWGLYSEINPDLILAPTHQDLARLAGRIADFMADRLAKAPAESAVKEFLAQPNRWGWEVKRKLIWLGCHSYLFRYPFRNYVSSHGGQADIATIDDFICQATTAWSGLGAIDILAATLESEERRADLRSWYERHVAYYRVRAVRRDGMDVLNLINEQLYSIRMDQPRQVFEAQRVVFGGLVPWAGRRYWSGIQRDLGRVPEAEIQKLKQEFIRQASQLAYRYSDQLLAQARETQRHVYEKFVAYHGGDLAVYPDGRAMAAGLQKMYRLANEALPAEMVEEAMKAHNLSSRAPHMSYPDELLKSHNGVAVYFNQEEGQEMLVGFNTMVAGLKKRGQGLTEDEEWAMRGMVESPVISPAFVHRLAGEYGDESIAAAYLVRPPYDKTCLAYLLRRYKGAFFRKRYPNVTLV